MSEDFVKRNLDVRNQVFDDPLSEGLLFAIGCSDGYLLNQRHDDLNGLYADRQVDVFYLVRDLFQALLWRQYFNSNNVWFGVENNITIPILQQVWKS